MFAQTVRRYVGKEDARRYGPRVRRCWKLDALHDYLRQRIAQARPRWTPATVLLREIADHGCTGGISQLKVFLARPWRPALARATLGSVGSPAPSLRCWRP